MGGVNEFGVETGTSACPVHCPCPVQSFQGVAVYCTSQIKTMFVYSSSGNFMF